MLLIEYLADYCLERELSSAYADAMRGAVEAFGVFLARPAAIADLTDRTLNLYLVHRLEADGSKWTTRGHRQRLLALWRSAYSSDPPLIDAPPRRIKPVGRPRGIPQAWTLDQLAALLQVVPAVCCGYFPRSRVPRVDFWEAFIATAYDTGLRLDDLLTLTFAQLAADGRIAIVQGKTGKAIATAVRSDTLAAIEKLRLPGRELVFGGAICRRKFYDRFKQLAAAAGLSGTSRFLRRSSGSYAELVAPGTGHLHLGNGRDVFLRHYAAPSIIHTGGTMPPPIR